jgi:hypothetical protein
MKLDDEWPINSLKANKTIVLLAFYFLINKFSTKMYCLLLLLQQSVFLC